MFEEKGRVGRKIMLAFQEIFMSPEEIGFLPLFSVFFFLKRIGRGVFLFLIFRFSC